MTSLPREAQAQVYQTWRSEATSGSWQGSINWWKGSAGPIEFGQQEWNNNHYTSQTNNNGGSTLSTWRWLFQSGASSAHTFSGDTVRFFDSGGQDPAIINQSSATHIINMNIEADGDSADPFNIQIDNNGGGGLTFGGTVNNQGSTINVIGSATSAATVRFNGAVSGSGGMYVNNGNLVVLFDAANTMTGQLTINAGTVRLNNSGDTFGSTNQLIRIGTGATLDLNGVSTTVGSVAEEGGSDSGSISLGGGTLTVTADSTGSQLYQSSISGSGGLTKLGSHTLNLFGSQSYTGTTTVTAGQLSTSVAMSSTNFTINGGTFSTDAVDRLANNAAVSISSGNFTIGGNDTVGSFSMTGGTLGGSSTLTASTYALGGGTITGNLGAGAATNTGTTSLNGTLGSTNLVVSGGAITLGSANRLSDSMAVTVSGGTLNFGATTDTVGSFTISSGAFTNGTLTAASYVLNGGTVGGTLGSGAATNTGTTSLTGTLNSTNLVVSGGTITLGSANRMSDTLAATVSGGTLNLGGFTDTVGSFTISSGTFTNGTLTAASYVLNGGTVGGTLGSGAATNTGTTSLTGTLNSTNLVVSGGTITLGSANRMSDTLVATVSGGTLSLGGFTDTVGSFTISSGVFTNGTLTAGSYALNGGTVGGTLGAGTATSSSGTTTLSGALSGALTLSGGSVTTTGANKLADAGAVTVNSGTLTVGGNDTVGVLSGSGGTLSISNAATLTTSFNSASNNFAGTITGAGGFTKAGSGTLSLSGDASGISGAISVSAGRLQIGTGSTTGTIGNDNVSLTSGADLAFNRSDNVTYSGAVSGSGGTLTKLGSGTLTLGGANSFTGALTIAQGAVSVGANNNLGGGSAMTISNAAKLLTTGSFASTRALTIGTGGAEINVGSATAFTNTGAVSGSTALTKTGNGTLSLSNASSSYSGTVGVTAGTLQVNGTASSMDVVVTNSGSVLMGAGSIGNVTVYGGSFIAPGNSVGNLSVSALTVEAGGGYNWELDAATGTPGTDWDLITVGGGTGTVTVSSTSVTPFTIYMLGNPTGWNVTNSYDWTLIDAGTLSGFSADKFEVDASGFSGTTPTGTFAFSNVSGDLRLYYTAVSSVYDVSVGANTAANQGDAAATNSVAQFTGDSALNKLGAGTLIMTNSANDYTGVTTVKEGTLQINVNAPNASAGALGNAASTVIIGDTSTNVAAGFNFGAAGVTNSRGLSVVAGTGSADRIIGTTITSGTAEQAASVSLATNATFSAASGGTLLFSGGITGAGNITVSNSGTTVFSASNTYTGTTTVLNGSTLRIANNDALGGTGSGTTVNSGGTLALSNGISTSEALTISGTGVGGVGALRSASGNNTVSGAITLGSGGATIANGASGSTLTLSGGITGSGQPLTISAGLNTVTISGTGINTSTGGSLVKVGAGNLVITASSDFTGGTTLGAGALRIGNDSALGTGALATSNNVTLTSDDATARSLANNLSIEGTLNLGSATTHTGALTLSGNANLNGGDRTLNVLGPVTMSGAITNGGVTKTGAGTLTLSGANTYSGGTLVSAGTLVGSTTSLQGTITNNSLVIFDQSTNGTYSGALSGTGSLTKTNAGTLTLSGASSFSGGSTISQGGVVVGNNSALGSGTVSLVDGTSLSSDASARTLSNNMNVQSVFFGGTGALSLNGNLTNNRGAAITITNEVTGGLTLSNLALSHTATSRTVTLAGSRNTTVNGAISDGLAGATSSFTINNTGTTTLNGANTFSGTLTLSAGTLVIGNNAALGAGSAVFANNTAVNSDATARTVTNNIQFQNLSIGGTGALTLSGTLTHTRAGGSSITNNNAGGLTLGNIDLSSSSTSRTVTFEGTGNTTVTGVIANGSTATNSAITLNATGTTLTLSGANTYGGATTITAGTLLAANNTALGDGAGATTVASGATLAFSNNISENETITISGNGVGSNGALRNISGNNTNTGTVSLGAASTIGVDAGTALTLSNIDTVFGTRPLTITANGSLTVLGGLLSSTAITNVLQKDGTGSMIVSNNGTTGGMQLQLGNGTFTLAAGSFSTNTSTTGSAASPRAIDLGISSAGDSTNNVAFYANSGVTVSNSIYVAPNSNSATRTLGTESTSGTATFNREIYLGGNLDVSAASGGTALFSGNIINSGNLTKTNAGTVILSGANTFGGTVAVNGGTLVVSNSAAINDTNAVTIAGGATLSLGSSETVGSIAGAGNITLLGNQLITGGNGTSTEFSGIMSSTSSAAEFVKFGAGTLTLSGANTMNGQLYLVNGTTLFTVNQGSGFTNTINLGETNGSAAATVAFGGSGLTVANPINVRSGNDGTMTIEAQNSAGTLTLGGALTLAKNATLKATNGGDVVLSGPVNIGTSQLFTDNTIGSDITISGNISADAARTGELLVDDTGAVYLTGNNSANMKVTLSQGTLVVGNITNLGDPSGTFFGSKLNLNGGTLSATNDVTAGANFGVTVSANGGHLHASSGKTLKFVDFINDTGAGTSAYTLGIGGGGTVVLEKASGNNQFNGNMTFAVTNGSTLSTPNLGALGNSATNIISLNNGTFAYTGNTGTASQRFTIGASGGTINVSSNGQTLSLTNAATLTGTLTKSGNGILDINRANTGTGGANVTGGILRIGNASALGTGGTVAVSSGATLQLSNGINFARNLTLSGNGALEGALANVSGANTNSGGITLGADAMIAVSGGSLLVSGNITNAGNRLTLDTYGLAGTPLTVGGIISGNGGLTKIGGGTAVLTGANNYTNSTLIGVGTLQVGAGGTAGQLGAGAVTISNGATLNFNRSDAITANNAIDGAGNLIKSGASTLTLGGANTYSGGTLISAGTLAGTTGSIQGNITNSGALIFDQSTTGTYGGIISGTGTLAMTNTGTVTLTNANTFSGGVTINGGTLVLDRTGGPALGGTNQITINNTGTLRTDEAGQILAPLVIVSSGGTYNLNGNNQTNALQGAGNVSLGAGTLSISNTGSDSFSGIISGGGGVTKIGAGAQTLSGANDYTGATTITAGELALGADNVIGDSSAVTVNGGTFALGARAETVASLTMSSGSVTRGGGVLTLNGASSLTGGTVSYSAAGASLTFGSSLELGGVTFSYGSASTPSGSQDTIRLGGNVGYASSATGQALFTNTAAGVGAFDLGAAQRTFNLTNSGTLAASTPEMAIYWTVRDGGITKDGTGALLLDRANTHTNTTLTAGDLLIGDDAAVGAGTVNLNGGTFASASATARTVTNALSIGGDITLGQASGGTGVLTFSNANLGGGARSITAVTNVNFVGAVTNGSLTKAGNATLALSNTGTSLENLNITAGTVAVQTNASVGGLAGSGTGALSLAGGTLTVNASTNSTFGQAITGAGALTKTGAGTVTLTASNNFSGATTISGGALVVNGTNTTSAVSIGSTGTLGGTGLVGATTVQSGGFISPGNSIGTLAVDTLTLEGGGGYIWEVADVTGSAGTDYDLISVGAGSGNVTFNATAGSPFTIYLTSFTGFTNWDAGGTFSWNIIDWGTVTGFDSAAFAVNTNDFSGTISGAFTFANTNGYLVMSYAAGTPTYNTNSGTWSAGFVPSLANGNNAIFDGPGGNATNNISTNTLTSIGNLTFSNTSGSYTLSADSGSAGFDTANRLLVGGSIVNNSTAAQTINMALGFDAQRTIDAAAGNMTFGGTMSNGVGLTFTGISNNTVSGVISGAGTIAKTGTGTLVLSGANDYTGATTISNGLLQIGNATALGTTAAGTTVVSGATLDLNGQAVGAEALSLAGTGVGGNGALINSSASAASLSGAVTLTGNSTIGTTGDLTLTGVISGGFSLTKTGTATLTLDANNTYSGGTVVNTGVVVADTDTGFGSGAITINGGGIGSTGSRTIGNNLVAGGDFFMSGVTVYNGTLDLGGATRAITFSNKATFNGVISNGGLTINAGGIGTDIVMDGVNTYTGPTTINGGELILTNDGSLSASTAVDLTGSAGTAALDIEFITADSTTIGSLAASNNASATTVALGSKTLIAGGNNDNTVFNGSMEGTGGFTKTGTGTMTFGAASSYTGATTISNGEVALSGSGRLANSSAVNLAGATARYDISAKDATTETNGSLAGVAGSVVNLGSKNLNVGGDDSSTTFAGILTNTGSLTKSGTGTMTLSGANTFSGGSTLSAGVLRVNSTGALGTGALTQVDGTSTLQVNAGGTITNNMSVYNVEFVNGGNTLSGTLTQNNTTYDVNAGETNNLDGFLTGSGGVTLIGGGQLNLTGTTNNYTGNTVISNGTLQISTLANSNTVSSIGVSNNITLAGANATNAVLDYTGGNVTTDRTFVLTNGGGTINMASNTTNTLTGSASGTGTLIVGEGTLVLSNGTANSFAPGSIQVDSGATLQLAANDQIGNTTGLILNGGTFRIGTASTGFSDTLGTLTLSASSTIDLGAWTTGVRQLTFANSSAITWTGTLTITNWQGVALQSSDVAEIIFGTGGLTSGQLAQVSWANQGISGGTLIGGNGELVPIPEPRVYAAAVALLAAVGWRERKRLRELLTKGLGKKSATPKA